MLGLQPPGNKASRLVFGFHFAVFYCNVCNEQKQIKKYLSKILVEGAFSLSVETGDSSW